MTTEATRGVPDAPSPSEDVAEVADRERRTERRVATAFVVTAVAATVLAFVYWTGGDPQWEGVLLAVALGGLGVGFVAAAKGLLPGADVEQEREPLGGEDEVQEAIEEDIEERAAPLGRRKLLTRSLGLGGLALLGAFSFPIRSLGPGPGNKLSRTPWRKGAKVVDDHGRPISADDVPIDALITVFPEGHTDAADAQAVLVRVGPDDVRPAVGRESWSPEGFLAFSKICTHAGCPVGLYQAATRQLLCPCHQSAFDVLKGAEPVFGPAARPLPQLPLEIGSDGVLRATGDFSEPVGPTYWNIHR
ncbi:MAG TPA: Rieske 2Fe-2S domain-containing protein [Acidimicrobiales bacterium]|nr:Rieske 2Fe-2S domain-containing protein [Acidimicrobiales bacterium]